MEQVHRQINRQDTSLIVKKFDDLISEMRRIRAKLRLTPSTIFLAEFIAKNFIDGYHKRGGKVTRILMIETAHASLLLASKLRERDIYCPMISHIIKGGGKQLSSKIAVFNPEIDEILTKTALRQAELNISHFFSWNLVFFTYYDHLEEFMSLGVLFEKDMLVIPSTGAQN
jgi:hypothetical protein